MRSQVRGTFIPAEDEDEHHPGAATVPAVTLIHIPEALLVVHHPLRMLPGHEPTRTLPRANRSHDITKSPKNTQKRERNSKSCSSPDPAVGGKSFIHNTEAFGVLKSQAKGPALACR